MESFDQLPLGTILPWVSKPTKTGCIEIKLAFQSLQIIIFYMVYYHTEKYSAFQLQIQLFCLMAGSPVLDSE